MQPLVRRATACAALILLLVTPSLCGEAKTYDDPLEQTVDVDQMKLDSLRKKTDQAGPEGAGLLSDAEGALGKLRGAVEEHRTVYVQYREASREPDKTTPQDREQKIRPLAKKLAALTKEARDLAGKFDVALHKASHDLNSAIQEKLKREGEAQQANTQKSQGDGTPGNPLKGRVSENDPGAGASSQATAAKGDVQGKVLNGQQEQGGLSAGPAERIQDSGQNRSNAGDLAQNSSQGNQMGGAVPGNASTPSAGNPLQGHVEKNVTLPPPAGGSASGPTTVAKGEVRGRLLGGEDESVPNRPTAGSTQQGDGTPGNPLQGHVEKNVTLPPPAGGSASGPTTVAKGEVRGRLLSGEDESAPNRPTAGSTQQGDGTPGNPLKGHVEKDERTDGPGAPKRQYVPLEPKYDTSRGTPDKGGGHALPEGGDHPPMLEGHVEKSERREQNVVGPTAKADGNPRRSPAGENSGNGSPDTLKGRVEERDKLDENPKYPTLAGEATRHRSFDNADSAKKKPGKQGVGVQWGAGFALRKHKLDKDNYGALLAGNAQFGLRKTSEGFEAKGEVGVSAAQTKCALYRGRHSSASIQSDFLSGKVSATAALKNENGRVAVKAGWGAEAKIFEVQLSGQRTFPTFNGMGIQIAGQASAGVGAAAGGDFAFDTSKGLHLKLGESIGLGPMQKLGFTVDLVKMRK